MATFRRSATRRGGARVVTVGYLLVGGSAFVLLAAGPRLLDKAAFGWLGLAWTVSTLFGVGIATPTEQLVSRRMNVGVARPLASPARSLVALGVVAAVACWAVGSRSTAEQSLPALTAGTVLAVLGWVVVVIVRGRLAGVGDLIAYGGVLAVEGGTRVVMVVVAWFVPGWSAVVLPLAVGLPLVLSAAVGLLLVRVPAIAAHTTQEAAATTTAEQIAFVLLAVGFQVCLNGSPILLEWGSAGVLPTATVGAFVAANTYFRTPALLTGGVLTHALVELSRTWGERDVAGFRAARRRAMRQCALLLVPSTAVLTVAAPFALTLYYGAAVDLPIVVLLALPVSTVVAVLAGVAVQPMLASGHSLLAAGLWIGGAIVTAGCLRLASGVDGWTAVGLVAGPSGVLVGAFVADWRLSSPFSTVQRASA